MTEDVQEHLTWEAEWSLKYLQSEMLSSQRLVSFDLSFLWHW